MCIAEPKRRPPITSSFALIYFPFRSSGLFTHHHVLFAVSGTQTPNHPPVRPSRKGGDPTRFNRGSQYDFLHPERSPPLPSRSVDHSSPKSKASYDFLHPDRTEPSKPHRSLGRSPTQSKHEDHYDLLRPSASTPVLNSGKRRAPPSAAKNGCSYDFLKPNFHGTGHRGRMGTMLLYEKSRRNGHTKLW